MQINIYIVVALHNMFFSDFFCELGLFFLRHFLLLFCLFSFSINSSISSVDFHLVRREPEDPGRVDLLAAVPGRRAGMEGFQRWEQKSVSN